MMYISNNQQDSTHLLYMYLKTKDIYIKSLIVREYSYLIKKLVEKYSFQSYIYDELYDISFNGLLLAIDSYHINDKITFEKFAVKTILREIKIYIKSSSVIKEHNDLNSINNTIQSSISNFKALYKSVPSINDISNLLGLREEDILQYL